MFPEVRPIDQAMIYSYSLVEVSSNIWLYKFLKSQLNTNTAIKDIDVKKNRQRNIIPAKVGILNAIGLIVTYIFYIIIYSIPNGRLINLDTGTRSVIFVTCKIMFYLIRSYILTVFHDLLPCIICPGVVIFNSPMIKSKAFQLLQFS